MKKLSGYKSIKLAIFISGRGSNLKSLIKFCNEKNSKFKIIVVISDRKNAKGCKYSKKKNIENIIINYKNKIIAEKKILKILKERNIRLICLAGFMKILSNKFIKTFKFPIINIHPSLLPKYKGLNTHKRVLINMEKYSGCTVHYVNSKLDAGKIILQKKVKISKNESYLSLEKKILKEEHILYPKALKKLLL